MPYSGDPAASDLDWIWFTIRDTSATPHFSATELAAVLADEGDKERAAGVLLKTWVIEMLQEPNFTIGSFSENHGSTLSDLLAQAETLLASAGLGLYAGGVSEADNAVIAADTDRPSKSFTTGMFRNPNA